MDTRRAKHAEEACLHCCAYCKGIRNLKANDMTTQRNANFVAVATIGICYVAELYLNRCEFTIVPHI